MKHTHLLIPALVMTASAHAQSWPPAPLPRAQETRIVSQHTGRTYAVQALALGTPPPAGYPVLYLLDGEHFFPQAAAEAPILFTNPATRQSTPILIIGITHTGDWLAERTRDFTPPPADENTATPAHGGADAFARFLDTELPPAVAKQYPADPHRQALFGHSYGGLFTVYRLARSPARYRHYFAASPSLWWDNRHVLSLLPDKLPPHTFVHISAGSREAPPPGAPRRKTRAMTANTQTLAERTRQAGAESSLTILNGEDHGSAGFRALHEALKTLRNTWKTDG